MAIILELHYFIQHLPESVNYLHNNKIIIVFQHQEEYCVM